MIVNSTTQNEQSLLELDAARYRYYRLGKALVIKCGKLTIFTGPNPDYFNQYPKALDTAIDLAIKNEQNKLP